VVFPRWVPAPSEAVRLRTGSNFGMGSWQEIAAGRVRKAAGRQAYARVSAGFYASRSSHGPLHLWVDRPLCLGCRYGIGTDPRLCDDFRGPVRCSVRSVWYAERTPGCFSGGSRCLCGGAGLSAAVCALRLVAGTASSRVVCVRRCAKLARLVPQVLATGRRRAFFLCAGRTSDGGIM